MAAIDKQYRYLDVEGSDRLFNSHREAFSWACASASKHKGVYLVCRDGALGGINIWMDGNKTDLLIRGKHNYTFKVI